MNNDAYSATTHGITVSVRSLYLADQSDPDENQYMWAYRIRITNNARVTVQLQRRTWHITDAIGRQQMVHGEGVVGEKPVIAPGHFYEYQSGTPLATASGLMHGTYHMIETATGLTFDIEIPSFSLDSPFQTGRLH